MVFGAVVAGFLIVSTVSPSWDASESRRNSFSEGTVATLRGIGGDLRVEAHFAPEDPRRADLERNAFRKLRRALPHARIDYVSATSTGLFEQTAEKYGEGQVKIWRRSYDIPPPPLAVDDPRHPGNDRRYAGIRREDLPLTESLKDTVARFLPYWR